MSAPSWRDWIDQLGGRWPALALGYRYEVQLGKMLDEKRISGDHLRPYLRNVDVQWGKINTDDLPHMDFDEADRAKFALKTGDVLVCEGGEVGRAALWDDGKIERECYFQKALHRLRPLDPRDESPRFLFHALRAAAELNAYGDGGKATIAHLPADAFRRVRFPKPSRAEQERIANFLDEQTARIDALIAEKERLVETICEYGQAQVTEAVTRGPDATAKVAKANAAWLGDVPAHWAENRIRRVCHRVTDGAHISPDLNSQDFAFVSTVDIVEGVIDFDRCLRTSTACYEYLVRTGCRPRAGDVLFSKDGTIGRTAVVADDLEFVVASSLVILSPRFDVVLPRYLDYWLNNQLLKQNVELQLAGAALRRISIEKVGRLPILVPPIEEQRTIVKKLDLLTNRIGFLKSHAVEHIDRLREYRSSLITAAVTGQLDINNYKTTS